MTTDTTKLIISPVIRQYFIDPLTTEPVVGKIYFYNTDRITLKNVYRQSGDPDNPFEVAENPIVLDSSGAIPLVLYLYPYSDDDSTVEELYYIEVRRDSLDSLVFALDDFPQNFESSSSDSSVSDIINYCPSYGFDLPVFFNYYTEENERPVPKTIDFSTNKNKTITPAVGWIWQCEDFSFSEFYYRFTQITSGTLDGNPNYLLNLLSKNIGANQNYNYFGFVLCLGSQLEGRTVNFQFYAQDVSVLAVSSLNIGIMVDEGDVSTVGFVNLDSTLSLRTLQFVIPDISASLTSGNEYVYLVIQLPLNQAFSINFSGTYCYIGDSQTIDRLPINVGTSQATQYWSKNTKNLIEPSEDYLQSAQPLSVKKGQMSYLDRVGSIFIASANTLELPNSSAVALSHRTLIKGEPLLDTLCDRFLYDYSARSLSSVASNSFVTTSLTDTSFTVATNALIASYTPWVSSNVSSVTITQNGSTTDHGVTAVIGPSSNQVDITFKDMFVANCGYTMFVWRAIGEPIGRFDIVNDAPQYENPINNIFGQHTGILGLPMPFDQYPGLQITNLDPGSVSTQAAVRVTFLDNSFTPEQLKTYSQTATDPGKWSISYYFNYLSYLDIDTPPLPVELNGITYPFMTYTPPYVIQFHVDSEGENITGTKYPVATMNIDSDFIGDADYLANTLVLTLTTVGNYTINVLTIPTNGQYISASTTDQSFTIVFYNTQQIKPSNPFPGVPVLYCEFSSSDTTATITQTLKSIFDNDIGGIPGIIDLEGSQKDYLPTLPDTLRYFVHV